jgi:hypothetical protein
MVRAALVAALGVLLFSGSPAASQGAYEGSIAGTFNGWRGDTIYKLQDGHIVQQAGYYYHYHYAYAPKVIIYQSRSGGTFIHIDGDDGEDVSITILK